nr:toprim domain-containing protein [Halochromatium roseum]
MYENTARFHPRLPYWDNGRHSGSHPALIARVTTASGDLVTLHRTYLTDDGDKAPVAAPRKLMAYPRARSLKGSAIRLAPVASHLGVAEGIETALAVQSMTGMSVWATGSTSLLAAWQPPAGIEQVTVWADRDRSGAGLAAARRLAARLERLGLRVEVELPEGRIPARRKSLDWLDVLQAQAELVA